MVLQLPAVTAQSPPSRALEILAAAEASLRRAGAQFTPRALRGDEAHFVCRFRFSGVVARTGSTQQLLGELDPRIVVYGPAMLSLLGRLRRFSPRGRARRVAMAAPAIRPGRRPVRRGGGAHAGQHRRLVPAGDGRVDQDASVINSRDARDGRAATTMSAVVSFAENCSFLYQGSVYANYCAIDVCGVCHGDTSACVCQPTRVTALVLFAAFTGLILPAALWVMARYAAFPASRGSDTSFVVLMWLASWAVLAVELVGLWLPLYDEENNCQRLANLNILYAPIGLVLLVPLLWLLVSSAPSRKRL